MRFRVILTAFALAIVLYLQFSFDIKDWVQKSSTETSDTSGSQLESTTATPP